MADENNKSTIIIKKIKKAAHGHHGGAWKVAYADFVTAMMAFFLLLWILGQGQNVKEGIQQYFKDPLKYLTGSEKIFNGLFEGNNGKQIVSESNKGGVTESDKKGGISRLHLLAQDIQTWTKPFEAEVFQFKVHPDRIQFAITAESLFSPGSNLLKPESEKLLNKIATTLKTIHANIMIEAHTDDLPIESPTFSSNWELSAARSATVVRYFIEAHSFDPTTLTAMAASEFRPIASNDTPEGRARNRRIDVYVIPDAENRFDIRNPASKRER